MALGIVGVLWSGVMGDEPTEIPLRDIWAYRMPGTREIGKLEKDRPPQWNYGRLIRDIRNVLGTARPKGKDAGTAFAVSGTGIDALREAHAVLVEEKKPRDKFPAGNDVSIVFFSYSFGSYVELNSVRRRVHDIDIRYRFRTHATMDLTDHIAIIPLTSLTDGKYRVNVIQSLVDKKVSPKYESRFFEPEVASKIVSGPFEFSVE
jgi:hypothetical protein